MTESNTEAILNYEQFRKQYKQYSDKQLLHTFNVYIYLTQTKHWHTVTLISCDTTQCYIIRIVDPRQQSQNAVETRQYTYEYVVPVDIHSNITDTMIQALYQRIEQYEVSYNNTVEIESILLGIIDTHSLQTYLRIHKDLHMSKPLHSYTKQYGTLNAAENSGDELVNEHSETEELTTKAKSKFAALKKKKRAL